jgi:hypothetical protein
MTDRKQCTLCGEVKPLSEFHRNPNATDGRHTRCAECINRLAQERRDKSPKQQQRKEKAALLAKGQKRCIRCNEVKPLDAFRADQRQDDGRRNTCRQCGNAAYRVTRTGQDKVEEIDRRKAMIAAGSKECTNCHQVKVLDEFTVSKGKISAHCKTCVAEYGRGWYAENVEKKAVKAQQWMREHKDRIAELSARWYRNNKDRAKARGHRRRSAIKGVGGSFTAQEFRNLCELYGNKCLCCGQEGDLTPDHVVPICKGGSNSIDNIQPLCLTCNLRKARKTIDYRAGV